MCSTDIEPTARAQRTSSLPPTLANDTLAVMQTFAPALVVWPLWLWTMMRHKLWTEVFSQYWSMSVAMILGSFVAGSTPLGGGVVAYPVSQLVLDWPTPDSRDASILVQSVGMNAAAYLLIVRKRELLDANLIMIFTVLGSFGVLIGLMFAPPASASPTKWVPNTVPSGLANIIFGTIVLCFAIAYGYAAEIAPRLHAPEAQQPGSTGHSSTGDGHQGLGSGVELPYKARREHGVSIAPDRMSMAMACFAVGGGFLCAQVGSGSDMALYIFGTFVWNPMRPEHTLAETELTASSVVTMGLVSLVASVARALDGGFTRKIMLSWGADSFIVVVGAPLGAYVLTPGTMLRLRRLFYAMAVVQVRSRTPYSACTKHHHCN